MSRPRELGLGEASFLVSARKASTSEGGEAATEPLSRAATEDLLWFSVILILPFTPSFPVGQVGPVGPLLLATREMTDKKCIEVMKTILQLHPVHSTYVTSKRRKSARPERACPLISQYLRSLAILLTTRPLIRRSLPPAAWPRCRHSCPLPRVGGIV